MSGISIRRPCPRSRLSLLAALAVLAGVLATGGPAVPAVGEADPGGRGALALVGVSGAAPSGTIVWAKGGEIWAMDGDGSHPRVLVPLSSVPGLPAPVAPHKNSLGEPSVDTAGKVLTFTGSTQNNYAFHAAMCGTWPYQYPCNTTHFGFNATGVYRSQGGQLARLSGEPSYCFNCTSGDDSPEVRSDGELVYAAMMCTGFLGSGFDCVSGIVSTAGEKYQTCNSVTDPAPNPANPRQIAYTGCTESVDGFDALVVTGPDGAGERVIGCDDSEQSDPAWAPDGDLVVVSEQGETPGLWIYSARDSVCSTGPARHALVSPTDVWLQGPRFTGDGRIIFEADGDIWAVPADCDQCTFPGDATRLTTGGDNRDPAWTAAHLEADNTGPTVSLAATAARQKVSKQVVVSVRSSEDGRIRVTGRVSLPGQDPSLTAKGTAAADRVVRVAVPLTDAVVARIGKALRAGATVVATVRATVTDAAGNATGGTVKVRLVR